MVRSVKKAPERSCIVCKQKKAKNELLRIVRSNSSGDLLEIDMSGKKSGRGAYVCSSKCRQKLSLKNINTAFGQEFRPVALEQLKNFHEIDTKS